MSFIKGSSCNTFTFLSVLPALMTHIFFQSKCIHLQQEQEGSKLAPITFPPSLPLKGVSFVLPLSAFKLGPLSLSVNYTICIQYRVTFKGICLCPSMQAWTRAQNMWNISENHKFRRKQPSTPGTITINITVTIIMWASTLMNNNIL